MKLAWTILLISALTDGMIAYGNAILAASTQNGGPPSRAALLVASVGAVLALARTIQQALKAVKLKVDLAGNPVEGEPKPPAAP